MKNIIYRVFNPKYRSKVYFAQFLKYEQEQKPKVEKMKVGHATAVIIQEVAILRHLPCLAFCHKGSND